MLLKPKIFFPLRYLQSHPNSVLGEPGRFQGLNVGVVLYKLDRIRSSLPYKYYLSQNGTDYLALKYGFTNTHLGAQDWVTLVLFEEPALIFPLSCKFNFQVSKDSKLSVTGNLRLEP